MLVAAKQIYKNPCECFIFRPGILLVVTKLSLAGFLSTITMIPGRGNVKTELDKYGL